MGASRSARGQTLGALGAAGLVASLWLPWYTIPTGDMARRLGALASLIAPGARLGAARFTAWQIFNTMPSVLLVAALIGGGLAVLALSDRAGNTSQLTILAGAVAAVLVGYRIAVPPGQGGFLHPAWGIYAGLVSALVMVTGGTMARGEDQWAFTVPAADWPPVSPAQTPEP